MTAKESPAVLRKMGQINDQKLVLKAEVLVEIKVKVRASKVIKFRHLNPNK